MTPVPFNVEMFLLARDLRGMTQKDVAQAAGFTQPFISQIQSGEREASADVVVRLADAVQVKPEFFAQAEQITGLGLSMVFYRKRTGSLASHLHRLQAEVNLRRIHVKKLLHGVNLRTPHTFEKQDIAETGSTPEDAAMRLSASWMIPLGPIRNLVLAIESAGGIVFKFPFGTTDIDAISQWPNDTPPLFFLNASAPADRARFSLAHELGHIIMHSFATDDIEREADRFAAEFLMPKQHIGNDLLGMNLARAAALKPFWRVSMAALIRRSKDLGKITEARYRDLFVRMGQLGMRRREPSPISAEEPAIFRRILETYLSDNGLSMDQLAAMLFWPTDQLRTYYFPATGLRIAQ
jgi:Zn-dependent peptidase ImmA (M78 family)/transcriptional regulator with XRE-family HTH domain